MFGQVPVGVSCGCDLGTDDTPPVPGAPSHAELILVELSSPVDADARPGVIAVPVQRAGGVVIFLGLILLIIGFVAHISILWTIGIILLVIGVILAVLGMAGREIGGRRHWY
jgi:hypothetical protein